MCVCVCVCVCVCECERACAWVCACVHVHVCVCVWVCGCVCVSVSRLLCAQENVSACAIRLAGVRHGVLERSCLPSLGAGVGAGVVSAQPKNVDKVHAKGRPSAGAALDRT